MLNNLKSNFIRIKIFTYLKTKRKLNIIKYNKRMFNFLNINKDVFQGYIFLKEYNDKYKRNIEDIDIKRLDLHRSNIGNEELRDLFKINFKKLYYLNLGDNAISDINILENVDFKGLKILRLNSNKLSDINILEKVKYENLEELDLSHNEILDINI